MNGQLSVICGRYLLLSSHSPISFIVSKSPSYYRSQNARSFLSQLLFQLWHEYGQGQVPDQWDLTVGWLFGDEVILFG